MEKENFQIENLSYDPQAVINMTREDFVRDHKGSLGSEKRAGEMYDKIKAKHPDIIAEIPVTDMAAFEVVSDTIAPVEKPKPEAPAKTNKSATPKE